MRNQMKTVLQNASELMGLHATDLTIQLCFGVFSNFIKNDTEEGMCDYLLIQVWING